MSVMTFIESRPTVKLVYIFALANLAIVQQSYASNDSETTSSYESCPYVNFEWKRPEDELSGHHACMTGRMENDGEEVTCTTQVKFRQNKQSKLLLSQCTRILSFVWTSWDEDKREDGNLGRGNNCVKFQLDQRFVVQTFYQTDRAENMQQKMSQLESNYNHSQRNVESLNTEVHYLKNQVTRLESNLTATANTVRSQENVLNDLRQKLANTTTALEAVRNNLASIRTEEGTVYCLASKEYKLNPSEGLYNKVKYVRVNFKTPFTKTPQVWGSMRAVDAEKSTNFRYNFQIRDITSSGFTLVCQTWSDTILHGIDYQWRATTPIN